MTVTVKMITELREKTGAGMMDCKKALTESNGDMEKAIAYLRTKGLADIQGRSNKTASDGTIGYYIHAGGRIGVMVEINCETDFASRNEDFQQFAKDVAMHIAAMSPQWISRDDVPQGVIDKEKEIAATGMENKPPKVLENIVNGKLNKFFKTVCLLEQPFVKDQDIPVQDLLGELASKIRENIVIKRFTRYELGM